jgi:Holliday junction resolvasome RuvABC endonuclease subunit
MPARSRQVYGRPSYRVVREAYAVPYLGVPVATIRRHATGKGNASKDDVIKAVRARGHAPKDDNEADALAILDWAISNGIGT